MNTAAPYIPFSLWLLAAACLILLLLIIFGYHLYQRSRMVAMLGDSASLGALAAKKDALEADVSTLRQWMMDQKSERLKLEAERHDQELLRSELAHLKRTMADRKKEEETLTAANAEADVMLGRRKTALSRLDAEIASLEQQRQELGPLEKYVQELRLEIDNGKIRLAHMAEQELKVDVLQHQAQLLEDELDELRKTLAPMRLEKQKLRQFIDQARHAATVKNEQILEQRQHHATLLRTIDELEARKRALVPEIDHLQIERDARASALASFEEQSMRRREELETGHAATLATLEEQKQQVQENLANERALLADQLAALRQDHRDEIARLNGEKTALQMELANLADKRREFETDLTMLAARRALWEQEMGKIKPRTGSKFSRKTHAKVQAHPGTSRRLQKRANHPVQIFSKG